MLVFGVDSEVKHICVSTDTYSGIMKRGYASASTGEDGATAAGNTSATAAGNTSAAAAARVKSNPSDCPSLSAANGTGFNLLNFIFRSILAHHLGLPLTALFYRQILPPTLTYPVTAYPETIFGETKGDKILSASYGAYETSKTTKKPCTNRYCEATIPACAHATAARRST